MIYSVSYFDLGEIVTLFGGLSPPNPRGDGTDSETVISILCSLFIHLCITIMVWFRKGIHSQLACSPEFFLRKMLGTR